MHLFRKRMVPESGAGAGAATTTPFASASVSADNIVLVQSNNIRMSTNRRFAGGAVRTTQAPPCVVPSPALSSPWAQRHHDREEPSGLHQNRASVRIGPNFPGLRNVEQSATPTKEAQTWNDQESEGEDNDDGSSVDTIAEAAHKKRAQEEAPQQKQQNALFLLALCVPGESEKTKGSDVPSPTETNKKTRKNVMPRRMAVGAPTTAHPRRGSSSSPIDISADEEGGSNSEQLSKTSNKTTGKTRRGIKRPHEEKMYEHERSDEALPVAMPEKKLQVNSTPPLKDDGVAGDRQVPDPRWAQKFDHDQAVAALLRQRNQAAFAANFPFANSGAGFDPMKPPLYGGSFPHACFENAAMTSAGKRRRVLQDFGPTFTHHLDDKSVFARNDEGIFNPLCLATPKTDSIRVLHEAMVRHQQQAVAAVASREMTPPYVPSSQEVGLSRRSHTSRSDTYALGTDGDKTGPPTGNLERYVERSIPQLQNTLETSWKSKYEGLCLSKPSAGEPAVSSWLFKQPSPTSIIPNAPRGDRSATPEGHGSASPGACHSPASAMSQRLRTDQDVSSRKATLRIPPPRVYTPTTAPESTSPSSLATAAHKFSLRSQQRQGGTNVQEINQHDVLLGRGGHSIGHAGNKRMREVIVDLLPCFLGGTTLSKSRVVDRVVRNVYAHGGRFLERRRDEAGRDVWRIIPHLQAREKVKQRFREEASGRAKRHPSGGKNKATF